MPYRNYNDRRRMPWIFLNYLFDTIDHVVFNGIRMRDQNLVFLTVIENECMKLMVIFRFWKNYGFVFLPYIKLFASSSVILESMLAVGALMVEMEIECFKLSLLSDLLNSGFVMVCACILILVSTGCCCN